MKFSRRVGASADVKELQYVIALMQTSMPKTRENATVSSMDLLHLLQSRYRIKLTHKQAISLVKAFAGPGGIIEKSEEAKNTKSGKTSSLRRRIRDRMKKRTDQQDPSGENIADVSDHNKMGKDLDSESHQGLKQSPDEEMAGQGSRSSEETQMGLGKDADEKNTTGISDGKEDEEPEHYLDMVQVLSMLLIPKIAKSAEEFREPKTKEEIEPSGSETTTGWRTNVKEKWQSLCSTVVSRFWPSDERLEDNGQLLCNLYELVMNGFPKDSTLDENLVRHLLLKYGETERAQNPELVRQMVESAHSQSGLFDEEAFVNSVSSDIRRWDTKGDGRMSTFFYDVFGVGDPTKVEKLGEITAGEQHKVLGCERRNVPFKTQEASIDMVCETVSSSTITVVTWIFFLLSVGSFAVLVLGTADFELSCDVTEMWCVVVNSIFSWTMLALILSIYGIILIVPLSTGNNAYRRNFQRGLFAVIVTLIYSVGPFVAVEYFEDSLEGESTTAASPAAAAATVNSEFWDTFQNINLAAGVALAVLFLVQALASCRAQVASTSEDFFQRMLSLFFASSNTRAETRLKASARAKIDSLIDKAAILHVAKQSKMNEDIELSSSTMLFGETPPVGNDGAMRNFVLSGERVEVSGGVLWTWRRIINGSLFHTEGIWVNTRLIIFQFAQVVAASVFSWILLLSVKLLADYYEEQRAKLDETVPDWVRDLFPTRAMVNWSLYPAALTAIAVMIVLIVLYIPSAVSTILKYRCQVLPSLGSPHFHKLRTAADTAYMNTGNAVYGMVGAAGLFYVVIGLIIFLFQWEVSRKFMLRLLAWSIGLSVTCGLKFVLTLGCRRAQYRGFYRTRPASASLASLALECWFIGLGGSVLVGRVTQFLLAALFYVGRIDVPFLSEDVAILGYSFDYVPYNFVKDLLVHEAHRHPYIERLSQLCLLRKANDDFGSDAGATWRQLVVLALLPWMSKYRVFDEVRAQQAVLALEQQRQEEKDQQEFLFSDQPAGHVVDDAMSGIAGVATAVTNVAKLAGKAGHH